MPTHCGVRDEGRVRTDRAADGAADFRPEQDHRGRHGHVDVRHGGLRSDARADGGKTSAEALDDLRPDDLRVGRLRATRVDHEADTAVCAT